MSKNLICKACGKPLVQIADSEAMLLGCNSVYCNMANVDVTGSTRGFGWIEFQGKYKGLSLDVGGEIIDKQNMWFSAAECILSDFWDCKIANEDYKLV